MCSRGTHGPLPIEKHMTSRTNRPLDSAETNVQRLLLVSVGSRMSRKETITANPRRIGPQAAAVSEERRALGPAQTDHVHSDDFDILYC